jgi:hypothetical protein
VAGQRGACATEWQGAHARSAVPAPFFHVSQRVLLAAVREAHTDFDQRGPGHSITVLQKQKSQASFVSWIRLDEKLEAR